MKTNFLHILDGFYKKLENGSIFKSSFLFLYKLLAITHILMFLALIYTILDKQIFSFGGQITIFLIILMVLFALFAFFGFTLWFNRQKNLNDHIEIDNEFIITPILAKFINTLAENIAGGVLIFGFGISLIIHFVEIDFGTLYLLEMIGLGSFVSIGLWGLIIYPLYAFLIVIVGRLFCEMMSAIVAIANNTKNSKVLSIKEVSMNLMKDTLEADVDSCLSNNECQVNEKCCEEVSEEVSEEAIPYKESKPKKIKNKKSVEDESSTLSSEFAE